MINIACVFGTRPEVIKMAPVIHELNKIRAIQVSVINSGQHKEMVDNILDLFQIRPDLNFNIMQSNQALTELTNRLLEKFSEVFNQRKFDLVIAQGDTTTTFTAALAAFYHKIPFFHVEAGLRSYDRYQPYPEEMNRVLISQLAEQHFAPTEMDKKALIKENITERAIHITGNTVVDSLLWIRKNHLTDAVSTSSKKLILATLHRRETQDADLEKIFNALKKLALEFEDIVISIPVHLSPRIQKAAQKQLQEISNIQLTPPLPYLEFLQLMQKSYFILTDSGGIQEEAPIFGKPLLVARNVTERKLGINAKLAKLVGTNPEAIYKEAKKLLLNPTYYQSFVQPSFLYGDGQAARRIVECIKSNFLLK